MLNATRLRHKDSRREFHGNRSPVSACSHVHGGQHTAMGVSVGRVAGDGITVFFHGG